MAKMSLEEKMAERMAARKVEEQNKNDLVIIQENSLILPDKKDLRELSYFDEITDKEEIRE